VAQALAGGGGSRPIVVQSQILLDGRVVADVVSRHQASAFLLAQRMAAA
jgi:hypothetical protein